MRIENDNLTTDLVGRGESCHFSHRLERKLQDEENEDIDISKEMTLNEEKSCERDELRKGKLGEGNFGY